MDLLGDILVFLHFVGWAALFGGLVIQLREPERRVNWAMRDGIGTAFVTGLAIVGIREAQDADLDHTKIAVKFGVALVILVLVMANLRRDRIPTGLYAGLLALTVGNMAVAVFW